MPKYKVDFDGVGNVRKALGSRAKNKLDSRIDTDIERGTHGAARKAFDNAPVRTGALRESIIKSVKREGHMRFVFGSHLPYAQRQEYEHKTKNAYFRRAVWAEQPKLGNRIAKTVKDTLD